MKINEKQLQAAMDADLDRIWGDTPKKNWPTTQERQRFKEDNRDEYVCIISAYLKAGKSSI